jgi:hypothetical protein
MINLDIDYLKVYKTVVTTSKPADMRDRYPGYLPKSWMNYKDMGIDG